MDAILPLQKLLVDADIGTDSAFKDFLSANSHQYDFIAPATLRKVLTQFKVVRIEFGLVYAVEGEFPTLRYWMGELGVRGRVEFVQESLNKVMREMGFKVGKKDPKANDTTIFSRAQKNLEEAVNFRGPHRWTGAREPSCGFQVFWKVQTRIKIEMPTLDALLAVLPILRDVRVDPRVYADLGLSTVQSLAVGGTWTRYYDWDVTLAPGHPGEMYNRLEQLLTDIKYVPAQVSGDIATWSRQTTGSFAYLSRPDAAGLLNFRIQPES